MFNEEGVVLVADFDLLVLGGGSGGIATANRAAEHGAKVGLIEAKHLGGTCVNIGCVPKKISWYASRVRDAIETYGPGYGFSVEGVDFDYQTFKKSRDAYIDRSRQSYTRQFEKNQITVIEGYGRFVDAQTLEVDGQTYSADKIVIATGGRPKVPNVEGRELLSTSDDFFAWESLPESVVIVGAGYIGVEIAGVLNGLGVKVDVFEFQDQPLAGFDQMLVDTVLESFEDQGIAFHGGQALEKFAEEEGQIACYADGEKVASADKVLMAIGRAVNTDDLNLEAVGVETDEKTGAILVDDNHQTSVANIYAVGDNINKVNLTPVAIRAGRQVAEYLYNGAASGAINYDNVPTVVFSHPALGSIGLSEADAIQKYGEDAIKVYTSNFYSMYTSAAGEREACHYKVVCAGPEEKVVGLHGTGEGMDEILQGFGVAIQMGATKADLDSVVAIHPTSAEEFVTLR